MREYPPDSYRVVGRDFRNTLAKLLSTFFAEVHQKTGTFRYRGYLWHAFTYGYQDALTRNSADAALGDCDDAQLYVHDEQMDLLWLCPRAIAISSTHPCNDTYLFPLSFDWLYVTTHENANGIGPFFVRRISSTENEEPLQGYFSAWRFTARGFGGDTE